MTDRLAVQVDSPMRVIPGAIFPVFNDRVMVPTHEEQGFIQGTDDELLIIIGQIPTGNHKVNMTKFLFHLGAVDNGYDLIAD